jgi:predicted dehydrogenase
MEESVMRLGVIGAGSWAIAAHFPPFVARDDVELFIVNRRDSERLLEVQRHFGFERATTEWREVIEAKPDLVVLSGPVHLRAEQARAALEAGAHVLAEKPFAMTAAEAWDLVRLAEERQRVLMLCYGWNEMGIIEAARRLLVEGGGVGEVEHVSVVQASIVRDLLVSGRPYIETPVDSPPRAETWGDPKASGGGYGQGQLTHGLGVLFRLLPQRATEVMAMTSTPPGASVELHDSVTLRLEGGAVGVVSGAAMPWGSFNNEHQLQVRVTGSRGHLVLDLDRPYVRRSRSADDDITVDLSEADATFSFARVVDRFVDLAAGQTSENRSPGELGARVVEVLEAMYLSAETGRRIEIDRALGQS